MADKDKKSSDAEWMQKIIAASNPKEENAKLEVKTEREHVAKPEGKATFNWNVLFYLLLFLVAALPRLYFLFFLSDPENANLDWYGDVYHRWQIAYLAREIGFHKGFLTLWDFKGLEYFWGLFFPLLYNFLFLITGSLSIMWIRVTTILSGATAIVLLFILVRRYFNAHVALATALFMSFMPVVLFSDTTGEQEPVGLALIFAGMLFWRKKSFWTGFLFALASMVRAEYWMITFGLVVVALIREKDTNRRLALAAGWFIPIVIYMKYFLDKTGNGIYPIYWNFLASISGKWFADVVLSPQVLLIKHLSQVVFVVVFLMALFVFWKKPRYYLLFLFGMANILFISYTFGFGAYLNGYIPRFWLDRLFLWPYSFLGLLVAVFLLFVVPKYLKLFGTIVGWIIFLVIIAATQLVWQPLEVSRQSALVGWPNEKALAINIAHYYQGGGILLPEDHPALTYALARYEGIAGKDMVGQMFDPYYYMQGDPYANWSKNRKVVLDWFKKENIRFMVVYANRERYMKLVEKEPQFFTFVGKNERSGFNFYTVGQ